MISDRSLQVLSRSVTGNAHSNRDHIIWRFDPREMFLRFSTTFVRFSTVKIHNFFVSKRSVILILMTNTKNLMRFEYIIIL